jgi:hypothetical protein
MADTEGSRACPNCGRVLYGGAARCPNCGFDAATYAQAYSAEGYAVSSETAVPRWLLLVGSILLLSILVYMVAPRDGGPLNVEQTPGVGSGGGAVLAPSRPVLPPGTPETAPAPTATARPVVASRRPATPSAPHSAAPTPEEDAAFWRRKAARDLREAQEYVPTREELQAREYYQWQDHIGISDESRAADFVTRRTPPAGGW